MEQWQTRLLDRLEAEVGDHLRSVIYYHGGGYDLLFVRDDVSERYTDEAIEAVVQELGVETLEKRIKEKLYTHGELEFTALAFEDGVELYFHTSEEEGIAVGVDREAFDGRDSLVGLWYAVADLET